MQQTRIEQGGPYYLNFVRRFPDVHSLSDASVDEVLKHWQGLGYYSRARNLHKAARHIVSNFHGAFPKTYSELLQLPGIGPYSAAAIASFSYNLPHPVVDGNVKRVLSRFTGIDTSIDEPATHREILTIAGKYMKGVSPGDFNQAIMNFGALVCKPKNPLCQQCPVSSKCFAMRHDLVSVIPVRSKVKTITLRHIHFIVLTYRGKILLERRENKDIWRGLFTPPLLERRSDSKPSITQVASFLKNYGMEEGIEPVSSSITFVQQLSHQTIRGRFHYFNVLTKPPIPSASCKWVYKKDLDEYGKPIMVRDFLQVNG